MPLLPLEPTVFPDDLLTRPVAQTELSGRWWVLHTHPRAEKALARRCHRKGVSFFLPLHEYRRHSRGRLLQSFVPLFPSYLFLFGDEDARVTALQSNQVVRCLPVLDQQKLHNELARVAQLIASGEPLTPEERLQPGSLVEIVSGPLVGLQGKVLRRGKQWQFIVEVELLQRGVSVAIDGSMIRPLEGAATR